MPFIPDEHAFPKLPKALTRRQNLFAGETQFWEDVRDNLTPWLNEDCPPDLAPIRPGYGYEVRSYYKSPSGDVEVFPGAQGQIMEVPNASQPNRAGYVKIHITQLDKARVVPMAILRAGNVHLSKRKFRVNRLVTLGVTPAMLASSSGNMPDPLSLAIHTFLSTLAASSIPELTQDFYEVLGGTHARHAAAFTRIFVNGVKKAGLFAALTKPNFAIGDIEADGIEIDTGNHSGKGIYLRVVHRKDDLAEAYVGRTIYYGQRYTNYRSEIRNETNPRLHIRACRAAHSVSMYELCVLEVDEDKDYVFSLCEQTFTSLLETMDTSLIISREAFEEALMKPTSGESDRKFDHRVAATRIDQIAKAAQKKSGWPGLVNRSSSGVVQGNNVETPLMDWLSGHSHDRLLWTRWDTSIPNEDDTQRVPIAIFRRTTPLMVNWRRKGQSELRWQGFKSPTFVSDSEKSFFLGSLELACRRDCRRRGISASP